MGDPKKPHKKYKTPESPFDQERLTEELSLIGTYGLNNKRELWRIRTMQRNYLRVAREMLSMEPEKRAVKEKDIKGKLYSLGFIQRDIAVEGILSLKIEDFLERRLQTFVYRNRLASSLFQARQLIVHGHIAVGDGKVYSPSYIVSREDEKSLRYAPSSPLSSVSHPFRQQLAAMESGRVER